MHLAWLTSMRQSFKETQMKTRNKLIMLNALAAAVALSLSACGGGDDEAPGADPTPTPDNQTLTGQVTRNMALKNVVVCMDLNANDACDAAEPASAATGEDGRYSLTYDKSAITPAQVAAASLIAPVLAGDAAAATTAVDMANSAGAATSSSYVLKRPAGTSGNINPLTTLLHAGVAGGMTDAVARENIAKQLAIAADKIEDYQGDPPSTSAAVPDTARSAAGLTANALRDGAVLEVGDQSAAVAAAQPQLNNLWFGDADNFFVQTIGRNAKAAGVDGTSSTDARAGKTNGVARADTGDANALYRTAYLTPQGWKVCTRDTLITGTVGNPSRSTTCESRVSMGYNVASSVAAQGMGELVTRWQAQATNSINTGGAATANLLTALGNTVFPSGASELKRTNVIMVPGLTIDNTWTRAVSQSRTTTLQGLPGAYPVANVNLANGSTTLTLGNGTGVDKTMRVAFGAASSPTTGVAQYYQCDLDPATQTFTSPPNCVATAQGTYAIETVNGTPVMRFQGAPATTASMPYDVVYTEIDWGGTNNRWVYRAHEQKPTLAARAGTTNRLNGAAWAAMKAQLGI